jgi:hypothetical protein
MHPKYGFPSEDLLSGPTPINVPKRAAWFLEEVVKAGPEGVTAIEFPGVRIGDCILKLRKVGVEIETIYEPHGGEFRGRHGRYVLRSRVVRLSEHADTVATGQSAPDTTPAAPAGAE